MRLFIRDPPSLISLANLASWRWDYRRGVNLGRRSETHRRRTGAGRPSHGRALPGRGRKRTMGKPADLIFLAENPLFPAFRPKTGRFYRSDVVGRCVHALGRASDVVGRGFYAFGKASDDIGCTIHAFGRASDDVGWASYAFGKASDGVGRVFHAFGRASYEVRSAFHAFWGASDDVGCAFHAFWRASDHVGCVFHAFGKASDQMSGVFESTKRSVVAPLAMLWQRRRPRWHGE